MKSGKVIVKCIRAYNKFNFHMLLALVNSSDLQTMIKLDSIRIYSLHFCKSLYMQTL